MSIKPRRMGARWRDATTPPEVIDIFRSPASDGGRFEVLLYVNDGWISGLDIDPEGYLWPSFELEDYQARAYRYRAKNRRRSWASLPEPVKASVQDWLGEEN